MYLNHFFYLVISFLVITPIIAQDIEGFYNDPSQETQYAFVQELLYAGGYVPEKIIIYQTLPNHAHVYRVKLDSVTGGFMFIRWDKKKKEHYKPLKDPNIKSLEASIIDKIGLNVIIKDKKNNTGSIVFEYQNIDQLNNLKSLRH